jgi:hypothetical protein|tara:strand:- start:961 stop:1272 length:312 start_codon:yes stop_codon:yes gene_type:complete
MAKKGVDTPSRRILSVPGAGVDLMGEYDKTPAGGTSKGPLGGTHPVNSNELLWPAPGLINAGPKVRGNAKVGPIDGVSKGPQKAKKLGGSRPGYGTTAKGSLS